MSKFLSSKFFTVLSLILIGFLGFSIINGKPDEDVLNNEIVQLNEELSKVEDKTKDFIIDFEYFKSETYSERQARLKLNLKNPGEFVAYIIRDGNTAASSSEVVKERSRFRKIIDYIFKRKR